MPTETEIKLQIVKESLSDIQRKIGTLIEFTSDMRLAPIEGELRRMFETCIVLTEETDNYDAEYMLRHESLFQLDYHIKQGTVQDYINFWKGRPQFLRSAYTHLDREKQPTPPKQQPETAINIDDYD